MSIHAHTRVFVMHSHKFLYMKHCWSNKRPVIFMGMKKASKQTLHIVKTSCRSMKAIIFQVFDHFANSPTNLLHLKLPKMGRKLKQSLEVPISTCELYVFTRKVLCFGTCRQVVCEMFVYCLNFAFFKILVEKIICPVIFDADHSFKQ